MKEEWLFPNAVVPVDVETTAALVAEIKRLIDVVGGMALAQPTPAEYAMGYAEGFNDGCKPKPEQEPIGEAHLMQKGFTHCIWSEFCVPVGTKFYTTPPQREWVGLTDEEIQSCWDGDLSPYQMKCIREIEAKLKEKNT
jgi:hypothetical protein